MLTLEFSRRLKDQRIAVNAAWPGIVNTEGMRAMPGGMKWFSLFMRPFMKKPADGAKTPLWLAASSETEGVTGKAFGSFRGEGKDELKLPAVVTDAANQRRMYEACERLTN